ncbi:uncharacterized protein SOCE836_008130 [Sorangium cellulosum]|uniref:Uncharacterized protein n=1 Tax=Sorangium cellulosum TaxID=56 RepID=A0A4V0NF79_SORCE|nr:uncharacterized protein SOCE836_008130 [Sorangium cellulosum]WCQ88129.1 hypothetical protein NQZ70_00801 [Sorangium sp. Soce836]
MSLSQSLEEVFLAFAVVHLQYLVLLRQFLIVGQFRLDGPPGRRGSV